MFIIFMSLKAVLFDVDGVLTNSSNVADRLVKVGFDSKKVTEFRRNFFRSVEFEGAIFGNIKIEEYLYTCLQELGWNKTIEEFFLFWFEADNHPIEENINVTKRLKEMGFWVYVATHQEKNRLKYLQTVQLPGIFDGWFSSCDLHLLKNDPEYFRQVLETLNLKADEVVHIDDKQAMLDSASSVGLHTILYYPGVNVLSEINKIR